MSYYAYTHDSGVPGINCWVYLLGEVTGEDIKVGYSTGETMRGRLAQVRREQSTNANYVLLAAMRGDRKEERAIKRYFADIRRHDKGTRTEYFWPRPELTEYANWLRQWWWTSIDPAESSADVLAMSPEMWLPQPDRRLEPPPDDPDQMIQPYRDLSGPLAGTPWDWMLSPKQSVQDYFTPPEYIAAAREAMGGLDLDAASHPIANRAHKVPDYFHINRSAFDNDWYGRVWLNPPYGNNAPWFERIIKFLDSGAVDQLCMLSPVWAFTTGLAKDTVMRRSAGMMLLHPTPKFWGNADNKTGVNHPHAVVYFGHRVDEFFNAFGFLGIPMEFAWDRIDLARLEEVAA